MRRNKTRHWLCYIITNITSQTMHKPAYADLRSSYARRQESALIDSSPGGPRCRSLQYAQMESPSHPRWLIAVVAVAVARRGELILVDFLRYHKEGCGHVLCRCWREAGDTLSPWHRSSQGVPPSARCPRLSVGFGIETEDRRRG